MTMIAPTVLSTSKPKVTQVNGEFRFLNFFLRKWLPFIMVMLVIASTSQSHADEPMVYQTDIVVYGDAAACLAIDDETSVQAVPYEKLRARLLKDSQRLK